MAPSNKCARCGGRIAPREPAILWGDESTHVTCVGLSATVPPPEPYTFAYAPEEAVDHPAHYGGADNPYEAIKVIRAWGLGFELGNAVKYIARMGKKPGASEIEDLKKARWYLDEAIKLAEGAPHDGHTD